VKEVWLHIGIEDMDRWARLYNPPYNAIQAKELGVIVQFDAMFPGLVYDNEVVEMCEVVCGS
jgi:hypothetical protein